MRIFQKFKIVFQTFFLLFHSELVCLTSNINVICQVERFEGSSIKIQAQIKILEQHVDFGQLAPEHSLLRVMTAILSQMTTFLSTSKAYVYLFWLYYMLYNST